MNRKQRRAMMARRNRRLPPTKRQRRQAQLAKLREARQPCITDPRLATAETFLHSPLASLPPKLLTMVAQADELEDFDLLE